MNPREELSEECASCYGVGVGISGQDDCGRCGGTGRIARSTHSPVSAVALEPSAVALEPEHIAGIPHLSRGVLAMNIEIFGCSGGMAEGFRRAGIVFDFTFDIERDHCDSYEKNLGHRPVQMDARDLLRMARAGWHHGGGAVDLVVADPPCTPWSRAGKRLGVADERDMLGVTCELIELLRPRAYLIGNVPGLGDSTQWHHLQAALAPLAKVGYCIRDFTTLDAADFGVPQHRVRPFWFGHLDGPCVRWPAPTHCAPEEANQLRVDGSPLLPWVTCRQALGHISLEQLGRPCRLRYRGTQATTEAQRKKAGKKARASREAEPAETVRAKADSILEQWGRERSQNGKEIGSTADRPARVVGTSTLSDGNWLNLSERHPPAHPAPTLGAKDRGQSSVLVVGVPGHHDEEHRSHSGPNAVILSELAATILQGFPESWVFCGKTKASRWSQLGQAMPPPLAEAVARSVSTQMRKAKERVA